MKTSKYFSISFIIIIFSFSFGIYINYIIDHINSKLKKEKDSTMSKSCFNYIDWEKEYPLNRTNNDNSRIKNNKLSKNLLFYKLIKENISKIDYYSKSYLPIKIRFTELCHFINKLVGVKMFLKLDNLIRFDNGYFGFIILDKESFEKDGKRTVDFANYLKKQNIKFGYILCPSKFSKFKNELQQGMIDYSNDNADSFIEVLSKNNIPVLDLREDMRKDYPNHFDAFFKTDHHWKPETGFWATQKVIKFLNQKLGQNLDENIIKKENFNFKTYPKLFLGSQGKKVTLSLAEPEDFTVITPKFNTNFNYEVYCRGIKKEGLFEKVLLEREHLNKNYYEVNTLNTYLGYCTPVARIKNLKINNNNKILIIKDSFICVVAPFLSCVSKELILVELRKTQNHFDGDLIKFIEKEKPAVVLKIFNCHLFDPKSVDRFFIH